MPTNVTPEYRRAERLYREAVTDDEKIEALELMLSTIPKHKGTEHLQSDIKRRLAKVKAGGGRSKGGARQKDVFHVPKGVTAGQVMLLGVPNAGKSALVAAMTNAHVEVADYPFSTHAPVPGVAHHEDVPIQLVDMPPITPEHVEPGQVGAYRHCDLIGLVVDMNAPDTTEELDICLEFMEKNSLLRAGDTADDAISQRMTRPCLCICSKLDLASEDDFQVLREMYGDRLDMIAASAHDEGSLKRLAATLFDRLHVVRVYSKLPGKEPDMSEPFTLHLGSTVQDLAGKVHRELAEKLRSARGWGEKLHPGQQIPRDHILHDKDVVELHFS